jgi:hypothetical protein
MKKTTVLLTLASSLLGITAAYGQVELTITGSTAFRSITIDRSASLFDAGSYVGVTNDAANGKITMSGTCSNIVSSLRNTPVKIRLSFSGSASGMLAVQNQTPISTSETPGVNVNKVPDLSLSDVYPSSATPPIPESAFDRFVIGVVPFLLVKNNALSGVNSLTREQGVLLMTATGPFGMPASYLGGGAGQVYLCGRDSGSGTRITVEKVLGFVGTPLLWGTNTSGGWTTTNGYSSGGTLRGVLAAKAEAVGYLGISDYNSVSNSVSQIAYNGVYYSEPNVATGKYGLWGYQHMVNRAGGLSPNQALVRDALKSAITNPGFQSTNALYNVSFVRLDQMQVERGTDGGTITSLTF